MTSGNILRREQISTERAGETILAWLRRQNPEASWSACRSLLAARRVTINGVVTVHEGRRLRPNDVVELSTAPLRAIQARHIPLLYLDREIVVVDKPAGIVTARRPEEIRWPLEKRLLDPTLDELAGLAIEQQEQRRPATGPRRPPLPPLWRVQRLDRETSGVVVFARTRIAGEKLIAQFAAHTVERRYVAIVRGQAIVGRIATRLVNDRTAEKRRSAREGEPGQWAVTHVLASEPLGNLSITRCRLETGRTHQIRIHLSEQGHPVCGDDRYSSPVEAGSPAEPFPAPRLALHAEHLSFQHPATGELMEFTSPVPDDLRRWLEQIS